MRKRSKSRKCKGPHECPPGHLIWSFECTSDVGVPALRLFLRMSIFECAYSYRKDSTGSTLAAFLAGK